MKTCEAAADYQDAKSWHRERYPDNLREPHWKARWSQNLMGYLYYSTTDDFAISVDGNNLENKGAIGEPIGEQ